MNPLVFCNPGPFAEKLKNVFGKNNILTSSEKFQEQIQNIKNYDGIIILAELNWNEKGEKQNLQDYYGITLAKNIRLRHHISLPILLTSFQNPTNLLNDKRNEIIAAVGHSFVQMPSQIKDWGAILSKNASLNEFQLSDIISNFCNASGLAGELFHRIKGVVREKLGRNEKSADIAQDISTKLREIKTLIPDNNDAKNVIEEIINKLSDGSKENINQFLRTEESLILSYFKDELEEGSNPLSKKPWSVLILDDQPDSISDVIESLHKKGIKNILLAENVPQAKQIIEEDNKKGNRINVVISDYRLLDKNDNLFKGIKQQPEQGYDFLIWLAKQDRFNRLVALSGLGKKFLLKSFRKGKVKVSVYSKTDLIGSSVNIFSDDIESYGDEVYEAISSQPTAEKWIQHKPFYTFYRNSTDYDVTEDYISNRAREIISQVSLALSDNRVEVKNISLFTTLKDLTADMVKKTAQDEKHYEIFKNKLIGRRVALWLYACLGLEKSVITSVLKKGSLDTRLVTNADLKSLFNMLAIRDEDFPKRILVEEKNWFVYYMGMRLNDIDEVLSQVAHYFQESCNKYFQNKNLTPKSELKKYFTENKIALHTRMDVKKVTILILDQLTDNKEKLKFIEELEYVLSKIKTDPYCEKYFEEFETFITELKNNLSGKNFRQ